MQDTGTTGAESAGLDNLRLELRRGLLTLAVLSRLQSEHYGYTLRKALVAAGLAMDEGTLYPLLRRLESQGLLVSQWREEDKRAKRFYRLSPAGHTVLARLREEWTALAAAMDRTLNGGAPAPPPAPAK
jgi:PadR family transcriptional regulator PadR